MQSGIAELTLQKRDDLVLYKELDRTKSPLVYRGGGTAPACSAANSWEPVDLAHKYRISATVCIAMEGVCLDRLPKQRSALPQQGILLDIPPQHGGLGSLPVAAGCFATHRELFPDY